jgi:hypothetical protein
MRCRIAYLYGSHPPHQEINPHDRCPAVATIHDGVTTETVDDAATWSGF